MNEYWIDWLIEESYEEYYSNYYYIAFASFKDDDYINSLINIEKALMLFNSNMFELDEENYIPLTEKKIKDLKNKIIIKLSKN